MTQVHLSRGSLVTISLYKKGPYEGGPALAALQILADLGGNVGEAHLYRVSPEVAEADALFQGEPEIVKANFGTADWAQRLNKHVFADCLLDLHILPVSCEARLRTKFYEDGTFSLNLDLPYTGIFEDAGLSDDAMAFSGLAIEGIATVLFESFDYLYGGIYWEEEAPSIKELKSGRRVLPDDFALYSRTLLEQLGRSETLRLVRMARVIRVLSEGGLFVVWSPLSAWRSPKLAVSASVEFLSFLSGFRPVD